MPSAYLWAGIPAALYYAYHYRNYCGQVPEIYGGPGAFMELLKEKCSVLREEYRPPLFVHEGRLMTILGSARHRGLSHPFMREIYETSDGGEIALDWLDARSKPQSASEVPVVPSSSLVDSLAAYFRMPQIPYFGSRTATPVSPTGNEETHPDLSAPGDNVLGAGAEAQVHPESATGSGSTSQAANRSPSSGDVDRSHEDSPILEEDGEGGKGTLPLPRESRSDSVRIPQPTGIVLILPGLTGDSTQNYVQGLVQVVEQLGYTAVVINYRGIFGALKTPKSYCAADTADVAEVIQLIKQRYPVVPIVGIGISLGGRSRLVFPKKVDPTSRSIREPYKILLTNYIARCGSMDLDSNLIGAMVVSVAWNFFESFKVLEQPLNWLIFNRMLTQSLCSVVRKQSDMLQNSLDFEELNKVRTLREFDDRITSKLFGYSGFEEYYKAAQLYDKIPNIKTPVLALNAADDMFSPYAAIPKEEAQTNPNLCIVITSHGGHIGFVEQRNPFGRNYVERLFEQYAKALFEKKGVAPAGNQQPVVEVETEVFAQGIEVPEIRPLIPEPVS